MKRRTFRAYAKKDDLQTIFKEFESKLNIYYVPTYSDIGKVSYNSIMEIENLGVNFYGSHAGNMQMLIFPTTTQCQWHKYQCRRDNGQPITRVRANAQECICVDLNGVYQENTIFPTEIGTICYDNNAAKKLYDELKKIFRKRAVTIINGFYICKEAYEHKDKYRFCTIDIKSLPDYDLKVD